MAVIQVLFRCYSGVIKVLCGNVLCGNVLRCYVVLCKGRASEPLGGLCLRCLSGEETEEREGVWCHSNLRLQQNHLHQGGLVPSYHGDGSGGARRGHEAVAGQERCVCVYLSLPSVYIGGRQLDSTVGADGQGAGT